MMQIFKSNVLISGCLWADHIDGDYTGYWHLAQSGRTLCGRRVGDNTNGWIRPEEAKDSDVEDFASGKRPESSYQAGNCKRCGAAARTLLSRREPRRQPSREERIRLQDAKEAREWGSKFNELVDSRMTRLCPEFWSLAAEFYPGRPDLQKAYGEGFAASLRQREKEGING